jgi:anaerobic magnesium-protoporphyrin IX monomethyl ester cyclase
VTLFSGQREEIAEMLARGPTVVAVTTTFYVNILPVVPVVEFIRQYAPQAHIVVGGPLIEGMCPDGIAGPGPVESSMDDLLTLMGADSYVVESQGEWTLGQLCEALAAGADLTRVPNLILEAGETWAFTGRRPETNNLDECAIDWSGFSAADLAPTAQMRTARSCAFKCSFCDYPLRAGALATASIDTVRRELRQLADRGVSNIVFVDDTFNVPPRRFKDLCRMMIEEDFGLSWYSYFRSSNARDEETFDLAARSGCAGVFLGIESADNEVLGNMHKLAQDDQYRLALVRFAERGVSTFASMILGFPGETAESVRRSADFLNETRPTFWRVQAWWANPRSPIYATKDLHAIEGSAYSWSHRTMDSGEAAALCDWMFDAVTESTWLPLYDFDFWSLPYLAGKGLDHQQVKALLGPTQQIMSERDSAHPDPVRIAQLQTRWEDAVLATTPEPARFSFAAV